MSIENFNNRPNQIDITLTPQQYKDMRNCIIGTGSYAEEILPSPKTNNVYTLSQKEIFEIMSELQETSMEFYNGDEDLIALGNKAEIERIRYQESIEDLIHIFREVHRPEIIDSYNIGTESVTLYRAEDGKHFAFQPIQNSGYFDDNANCTKVAYQLPKGYTIRGNGISRSTMHIVNSNTGKYVGIESRNGKPVITEDGHTYILLKETAELNTTPKRLFIDMDGTLAEFQKLNTLEKLYEPGYFKNLKPIQPVIDSIKLFMQKYPQIEVNVLSAVLSDSKYAAQEKLDWLNKNLPEMSTQNIIFCPCGTDKKAAIPNGITENDYLLDDYTNNLTLWEPPGRGIKLLNGINNTHGTWQESALRYDNSPEAICESIHSIVQGGIIRENITFKLSEKESTEYTILDRKGNYALLGRHIKDTIKDPSPYIVASNLQIMDGNLIEWDHGHYCDTYANAHNFLEGTNTQDIADEEPEPDYDIEL